MKTRLPKLCRSKSRNLAFVYEGKRKIYLGKQGAPETVAAYRRYIAELADDRGSVAANKTAEKIVTVAELAVAFLSDKKGYYVKDGASTRRHERYRAALAFPVEFFPATPVDEFGPKKLLFCRDEMVKSGRFARTYINTLINCVRSVFRWGVGLELVRPETLVGLQAVPPLKRDKSTARETEPVEPVPGPVVDATLPFLPDRVAAMVRVQRLTGMRPGEVCAMRFGDVETSGDVWIYALRTDKTARRRAASAKKRVPLGPQVQAILTPYLAEKAGDPDAFLFSPRDAARDRAFERRRNRRTPERRRIGTPARRERPRGRRRRSNESPTPFFATLRRPASSGGTRRTSSR